MLEESYMQRRSGPDALAGFLLRQRVVRFALVGAVGIPVNVGLLWLFHKGLHLQIIVAWLWAFEMSALLNFYANQRFTYREQTHVHGNEWLKRAFRAQLSSASGVLVNAAVFALLLGAGIRYLEADAGGIVAAFFANFAVASRFVFTPAGASPGTSPQPARAQANKQCTSQVIGVTLPARGEPGLALGSSGSFVSTEGAA
jgi:putative flippase GtrA